MMIKTEFLWCWMFLNVHEWCWIWYCICGLLNVGTFQYGKNWIFMSFECCLMFTKGMMLNDGKYWIFMFTNDVEWFLILKHVLDWKSVTKITFLILLRYIGFQNKQCIGIKKCYKIQPSKSCNDIYWFGIHRFLISIAIPLPMVNLGFIS